MRTPPYPEGARLVLRNGRFVPVELIYVGWKRGRHVWAALPINSTEDLAGARVQVDLLPPKTEIRVAVTTTARRL